MTKKGKSFMLLTGVLRDADDKSGDFEIFSEGTPYSTFNFHYEKKNFDRLHNLMRFNTLLHKEVGTFVES